MVAHKLPPQIRTSGFPASGSCLNDAKAAQGIGVTDADRKATSHSTAACGRDARASPTWNRNRWSAGALLPAATQVLFRKVLVLRAEIG